MDFIASGKLLLFGEYLVLKGAECLAFPLKFEQSLKVTKLTEPLFIWESKVEGAPWFSAEFTSDLQVLKSSDDEKAITLLHLLKYIKTEQPSLFQGGLKWATDLDFPRAWGFGSSSTLISLLAQWSGVNPYDLLAISFGGSGYDVACATADSPILYHAISKEIKSVHLSPAISDKLLFVYSGQKQNSAQEVQRFDQLKIENNQIEEMTDIVLMAADANNIDQFEMAMEKSEQLLSGILNMPILKTNLFNDYPYAIKSLGAWGGDFFMATYRDEQTARTYFEERGYGIQFNYQELIKK